jgi:hypothetical protein
MAGRDEGTGALIEPRNNRARLGLAVRIIRRLQSFTQWWVRLIRPHTQKFGYSQLIAELRRNGHDTAKATELLATLEETQRLHIVIREQIQRELWTAR